MSASASPGVAMGDRIDQLGCRKERVMELKAVERVSTWESLHMPFIRETLKNACLNQIKGIGAPEVGYSYSRFYFLR